MLGHVAGLSVGKLDILQSWEIVSNDFGDLLLSGLPVFSFWMPYYLDIGL